MSDIFNLTNGTKIFIIDYSAYAYSVGNGAFILDIFKDGQKIISETRVFFFNVVLQHLQFDLFKSYSNFELPPGLYTVKFSVSSSSPVKIGINTDDFLSISVLTNS